MLDLILIYIIVFLGFPLGIFLYQKTKEEYVQGKKYYKLLSIVSLAIIGLYLLVNLTPSNIFSGLIIIVFSYFLTNRYKILMPFLIPVILSVNLDKILLSSLSFIYLLTHGTIISPKIKVNKFLTYFILFSLSTTIIFLTNQIINPYLTYYALGSIIAMIKDNI